MLTFQPAAFCRTAGGADHPADQAVTLGGTALGTGRLQQILQFRMNG